MAMEETKRLHLSGLSREEPRAEIKSELKLNPLNTISYVQVELGMLFGIFEIGV